MNLAILLFSVIIFAFYIKAAHNFYNKSQRKPPTSVVGMNLPKKKLKKILDKFI